MNNIKKMFILEDENFTGNTANIAKRLIKYGRITKKGEIIIDADNLTQDQILKLCLSIKFIANEMDDKIEKYVKPTDLVKIMNERSESIGSRLSKLLNDGFVKKVGYGRYVINNYKIETFIKSLEDDNQKPRSSKTNIKSGGSKKLTGIGADIESLIYNNFFSKPKTIKDVELELKRENKYYDSRVIDATMKNIFIRRRIVKRIENENGGKAKWQYVIR